MRKIDADELLKALKKKFRQNDYIKHDSYFEFKNIVENMETVEERQHGHWDYSNIAKQGYKCSVCNRSSKNGSPFCQWCGAIME